jgi:hypothetical protein
MNNKAKFSGGTNLTNFREAFVIKKNRAKLVVGLN